MAQLVDWVWQCTSGIASLLTFAILFAIALVFIFLLFPLTKRHYKDITTLDGNPWGFSPPEAKQTLDRMSEAQLRVYRNQELFTDLLFPLVYGIGFAVAMVLLARYTGAPRWLVLLPYLAMIADWCENLSVIVMIGRHLRNRPLGAFATFGSIASRLKHALVLITVLVLIGLGAWALWRRYM